MQNHRDYFEYIPPFRYNITGGDNQGNADRLHNVPFLLLFLLFVLNRMQCFLHLLICTHRSRHTWHESARSMQKPCRHHGAHSSLQVHPFCWSRRRALRCDTQLLMKSVELCPLTHIFLLAHIVRYTMLFLDVNVNTKWM